MFNVKSHNTDLYNTLLGLSRNIFFYKNLKLIDSFETRVYLMFFHFSLMMIIYKKKKSKFSQKSYDSLFHNIENNLREMGFGDVSVNKKMKEFNKLLYDILLKIENHDSEKFKLNENLVFRYFNVLNDEKKANYKVFELYFSNFYDFCFGLDLNNMIIEAHKFKFTYGSS